ncbi:MAG: DUF2961 domain-containing protein [Treponema sp.]|nr:DUF2961 domain-containing protein [Treponema sp.]
MNEPVMMRFVRIDMYWDDEYPSICGTGTEDYIGSAWGMDGFANRTQGCFLSNRETGVYSFYRFHLEDAVFFYKDIKVQIQAMGGGGKNDVLKAVAKGMPVKITVTMDKPLFEESFVLDESSTGARPSLQGLTPFSPVREGIPNSWGLITGALS